MRVLIERSSGPGTSWQASGEYSSGPGHEVKAIISIVQRTVRCNGIFCKLPKEGYRSYKFASCASEYLKDQGSTKYFETFCFRTNRMTN
ncbi:hypothetical protein U0070_012240 [Myodes glareolus]|uniref:Uncharacterized protein n=1 Tax=Myodes glareolus TaxID=447135 RepID=A0AAW0JF64_MYOGA